MDEDASPPLLRACCPTIHLLPLMGCQTCASQSGGFFSFLPHVIFDGAFWIIGTLDLATGENAVDNPDDVAKRTCRRDRWPNHVGRPR